MSIEDDADLWVARRLKDLRSERGITLTTLAEQTGISSAHLSRLEKGLRKPSIGSLLQIARVYGVSISELVQEPDADDFHLVRAEAAMTHDGQDGRYTVLSGPRETMSVIRVVLEPGKHTKMAKHVGEEWLHVLSGAITLDISGKSLDLAAGDSVHFDSSKEHRVLNDEEADATVLIASTAATVPMRHPIPASRRGAAG
ncbi:cupin domain-containing protein [Streptomyces pseudovenezuelae]|uniref:Transcriptional regulator with XRE-family HTH domain n=1 Tax=Streptomyces pseudovenezuelae TaxID=67350 RepID=A0ABT6LB30_9ACTN|nr:cupin domain-containing protein [Streptomyces pseudovenezuelae]MDH6213493.1 transcriptional regulator with XRE-family HTH domain [Streptomyces pseudovenezuelae]